MPRSARELPSDLGRIIKTLAQLRRLEIEGHHTVVLMRAIDPTSTQIIADDSEHFNADHFVAEIPISSARAVFGIPFNPNTVGRRRVRRTVIAVTRNSRSR